MIPDQSIHPFWGKVSDFSQTPSHLSRTVLRHLQGIQGQRKKQRPSTPPSTEAPGPSLMENRGGLNAWLSRKDPSNTGPLWLQKRAFGRLSQRDEVPGSQGEPLGNENMAHPAPLRKPRWPLFPMVIPLSSLKKPKERNPCE